MSTPLASFFTKIGFEVDPSALKKVENTFDRLQKQAQNMAKALQTPTQRMQERLNVSAMRQQVLMQEKKNQGILNQIAESKNLVRQRERENKLDDTSRRHSMFMEKSLERRQQIVAQTGLERQGTIGSKNLGLASKVNLANAAVQKVDKSSLNSLEKQLGVLENRIASMAKSFQGVTNNPAVKAAASLARAEANKIVAETRLLNERVRLATIESKNLELASKVNLANAAVQKVVAQTGLEKERQGTIYSRVNASEMIKRMQVGAAADMAAIKESFASGQKLRKKQEEDENLGRNLIMMRKRNEVDESKARRELIRNQSYNNKVQLKGVVDVQRIQAQTAKFAQQAITKATPYAQRTGVGSGGSSPSGGIGGNVALNRGDIGGFLGAYLGLDLVKKAVGHSFNMGNFQVSQPAQYKFLTGSEEGAQEQIKYVNGLVDKLKLNLVETNQAYVQFLGATVSTIGADKTQQIFENLQSFGVMMGATGDQLKRGTKAVSQMLSKQKLSAEELECRLAA